LWIYFCNLLFFYRSQAAMNRLALIGVNVLCFSHLRLSPASRPR